MENESYEKRYDEQVHSLELKVKELVNKGELAKLQLERMKMNKSKSMYDERHKDGGESDDFSDLRVGHSRASLGMSAADALDTYERDEFIANLLSKGATSDKQANPLSPEKLYKAALGVGMKKPQAIGLTIGTSFYPVKSCSPCTTSVVVYTFVRFLVRPCEESSPSLGLGFLIIPIRNRVQIRDTSTQYIRPTVCPLSRLLYFINR